MGSDRQSIMLHENGKKHKENVERALTTKRINKQQEDQKQKFLEDSLKQMERVAHGNQRGGGVGPSSLVPVPYNNQCSRPPPPPPPYHNNNHYQSPPARAIDSSWSGRQNSNYTSSQSVHPLPYPSQTVSSMNNFNANKQLQQQEKIDWQSQKVKREEINAEKRRGKERADDTDTDEDVDRQSFSKRCKFTIPPDGGFYTYNISNEEDTLNNNESMVKNKTNTTTYLEGTTFFGLLCEEMPIEIWSGPVSCSSIEKRLPRNRMQWKNALVVAVRNNSKSVEVKDEGIVADVSYLRNVDDAEETIEKNLPMHRIRIILGDDKMIPDTIEGCRLLILGGEEIQVANDTNKDEAMEATGLSQWSTVSIKKTSVIQQSREEKEKVREQRRQLRVERETEQKRAEARRMEEAKVSNADDSALGAYDVWGKGLYKGIDISNEVDHPVEETAKRLATEYESTIDGTVSVKKISFKKRKKKSSAGMVRRKTSADDI